VKDARTVKTDYEITRENEREENRMVDIGRYSHGRYKRGRGEFGGWTGKGLGIKSLS
jgi:hypothetical protein